MFGADRFSTWKLPLLWGALIVLLGATPYVLNAIATPPESVFSGAVCLPYDRNLYLSFIRLGRSGNWLLHNLFTLEPHKGFVRPLWTLVGFASDLLGQSASAAYATATFLLVSGFLAILWWFLQSLALSRGQRMFAFILVTFGSGWSWLLNASQIASLASRQQVIAPDRMDMESNVFTSVFDYPQASLTIIALLVALAATVRFHQTRRIAPALFAFFAALTLGLHPQDLVTLAGALGVWWMLESALGTSVWLRSLQSLLPALVGTLASATYYRSSLTDPVFAQSFYQFTLSPPPFSYVLGFGIALPLAFLGIPSTCRRGPLERAVASWAIALPFLLYLPIFSQRRVIVGAGVPLAILAVYGLDVVREFVRRRFSLQIAWPRAAVAVLLLAIPSNLLMVGRLTGEPLSAPRVYYLNRPTHDALVWLDRHGPPDASVLCSFQTGNYLPGITGQRVFVGHSPSTLRLAEKLRDLRVFFDSATPDETRRAILRTNGITHLVYGPLERDQNDPRGSFRATFDPHGTAWAKPVYDQGGVAIFEVSP